MIEAFRNRLALLSVIIVLGSFAIAVFLRAIAITETAQIQAAIMAAMLRLAAVFLIAAFVITSQVREATDKGMELLLSHALSRTQYVAGKFLGYVVCAALLSLLFGAALAAFTPLAPLAVWDISLFFELCIIAAASLFCVLTFSHIVVSLAAVAGFYVLARSMAVLQIMGSAQLESEPSLATRIASTLLDAIAFVVPRLDLFTQTAWLTYAADTPSTGLGLIATQSVIYALLLGAAALFDFYRKNL